MVEEQKQSMTEEVEVESEEEEDLLDEGVGVEEDEEDGGNDDEEEEDPNDEMDLGEVENKDILGFEDDDDKKENTYSESLDKVITGEDIEDFKEEEEEDDNDEDMEYLYKFDDEIKGNYISEYHPEEFMLNNDEVRGLCAVTRNASNVIVDELHKTIPHLTKYEYTGVLGVRAKQINEGSVPFVKVDKEIMDGYLIAQIEIKQKKLPFIIKRPLPNGGIEYWRLGDLEILF